MHALGQHCPENSCSVYMAPFDCTMPPADSDNPRASSDLALYLCRICLSKNCSPFQLVFAEFVGIPTISITLNSKYSPIAHASHHPCIHTVTSFSHKRYTVWRIDSVLAWTHVGTWNTIFYSAVIGEITNRASCKHSRSLLASSQLPLEHYTAAHLIGVKQLATEPTVVVALSAWA